MCSLPNHQKQKVKAKMEWSRRNIWTVILLSCLVFWVILLTGANAVA
jgi:hypothetical protein